MILTTYARRQPRNLIGLLLLSLLIIVGLLFRISLSATSAPLEHYFAQHYGWKVSESLLQEAIRSSARELALDAANDLENSDISPADYQALVREATDKFGSCQQYRLLVLSPRTFPCHTCTTQPKIALLPGQTFKIGQTCGDEKFRYGSRLPEPGLKFFKEMEGTIFEVLVAEYIQLKLFRYSTERKAMLQHNHLPAGELQLPPGNKQLR